MSAEKGLEQPFWLETELADSIKGLILKDRPSIQSHFCSTHLGLQMFNTSLMETLSYIRLKGTRLVISWRCRTSFVICEAWQSLMTHDFWHTKIQNVIGRQLRVWTIHQMFHDRLNGQSVSISGSAVFTWNYFVNFRYQTRNKYGDYLFRAFLTVKTAGIVRWLAVKNQPEHLKWITLIHSNPCSTNPLEKAAW